eukprot:scaffold79760_cov57-Attheya_sp.AAC.8
MLQLLMFWGLSYYLLDDRVSHNLGVRGAYYTVRPTRSAFGNYYKNPLRDSTKIHGVRGSYHTYMDLWCDSGEETMSSYDQTSPAARGSNDEDFVDEDHNKKGMTVEQELELPVVGSSVNSFAAEEDPMTSEHVEVIDSFGWKEFSDWATSAEEIPVDDAFRPGEDSEEEKHHPTVEQFMAPNHPSLVRGLKRRHAQHKEHTGVQSEEVSYELLDTPVWHNRNNKSSKKMRRQERWVGRMALVVIGFTMASIGSGIAEAKAVLNGIVIEKCTDLLTAFCKGFSVIFAAAASLPVGLEGPMIFIGLSIGEHVSHFMPRRFPGLRTYRATRDFAAVGTASGVSIAFYAPIGGVLFALEEGASFWSQILMWRCFAAGCVTLLVAYFWVALEAHSLFEPMNFDGVAKFTGLHGHPAITSPRLFYLRDYFIFCLIGIAGGCAGALFNTMNKKLMIWRRKIISNAPLKCAEVIVLTLVMSTLMWWLPDVYKRCSSIPPVDLILTEDAFVYRQYNCPDGEYNHLATLFLNNLSTVINLMFHSDHDAFTASSCLIAGTVYFVMLLILFGSSIGMGIFIPLLYIGATYGRAAGLWVDDLYGQDELVDNLVQTYAVVTATGMLGGVVQVLISLSVIMMQATALSYFVVAFMIVTIFARVTARLLGSKGIYDAILDYKGLPFLEEMPPEFAQANSSLRARDIMSPEPMVTLEPEIKVSKLLATLTDNFDLQFAVMSPLHDNALIGVIQRVDILDLLKHRSIFYNLEEQPRPKAILYDALMKDRPDIPKMEQVQKILSEEDMSMYIDISPYVQIAPYAVDGHESAERAYEMFRMTGLQSILVLGPDYRPIGIIRRSDLVVLQECDEQEEQVNRRNRSVALYASIS